MYTCAIVEDEPAFIDQFTTYLKQSTLFHTPTIYTSGLQALEGLSALPVDIIFLDFDLPDITGYSLLTILPNQSAVIMITIHRDPAVECFDLENVVDYILKPATYHRFLRAVGRGISYVKGNSKEPGSVDGPKGIAREFIYLKSGRQSIRFQISEIRYAEAFGAYVKLFTNQGFTLVNIKLSDLESELNKQDFMRVHKSFIININHATKMKVNQVYMPTAKIPVGITYRPTVRHFMETGKPVTDTNLIKNGSKINP